MKPRHKILPFSLAIAALLDGAGESPSGARAAVVETASARDVNPVESIHMSRLWARKQFVEAWSSVEGHRSHYSHRSSRGGSHGNSWHGNSHSNSHRSHYSSRSSTSGGGYSSGSGSNIAKRAAWRVIWRDDDDNDGIDGVPNKPPRTTTTTTTTIPTVTQEQFVQEQFRYETCWFDDGDLGAPVVLQLRDVNGEWKAVKSPTAKTVLQRFELVENSKCTVERPHSAVTTWVPTGPGVYYLRHYYVGFKGIAGFAYEEIVMLVIR